MTTTATDRLTETLKKLPIDLGAMLARLVSQRDAEEQQREEANRKKLSDGWQDLLVAARRDLPTELWPFLPNEDEIPEDFALDRWNHVRIVLPGLCPVLLSYGMREGGWIRADDWRVELAPWADAYDRVKTLEEALLRAYDGFEMWTLRLEQREKDSEVPF